MVAKDGDVDGASVATRDRLSAEDATLLCVEPANAPLQVGALCLFEAGPLLDRAGRLRAALLRRHLESRLHLVPHFRQRLASVPFAAGRPVWVDDADFDIAHHTRTVRLPRPGSDAQLRAFVRRFLEAPLDHRRPLWEIATVTGLEGERIAVVLKVHHVLADGMALLRFATAVLDVEPHVATDEVPRWRPEPAPSPAALVAGALVDRGRHGVEMIRKGLHALGRSPSGLLGASRQVARAVGETAVVAPSLPITGRVGDRRDFAWTRLPLATVKDIAHANGATVNDVVLTLTAGALRHHLIQAGRAVEGVHVRVLVPVSVRTAAQLDEMGNQFSLLTVALPVGVDDPIELLREVQAETARHKASGQVAIGSLLFGIGGLVPAALLRAIGPEVLARQPFVNLAVTNLPGPQFPLYLLGSRLLELYPAVCGTGNIAMIVGVLSYDGALGVAVTVDADVVPDADAFLAGFERAAAALRSARVRTDGDRLGVSLPSR